MNRLVKPFFLGSTFVFGIALTPVLAQHEGQGHGHAGHQHGDTSTSDTPSPTCPVMGEPVNLAVSLATDDGPVFFCCENCISKYQADPAKYAAKVAAQRKTLAQRPKIQVTCPVSKEPVDQDVFVETDGKKVYFCCPDCINKYQKDPAKYASALANSYTYQTRCPVMGEDIDPKAFTTVGNGKKIYFCCKGCDKKLFKNPSKYAPSLAAQRYRFDAKEMGHDADDHADHGHGAHDHGDHDHD